MNRRTTCLASLCAGIILAAHPAMAADSDPNLPVLPTSTTQTQGGKSTPATTASPISTPGTDTTPPGALPVKPEGLTDTGETGIWDQDTMSGDWGGLRSKLVNDGLTITPTWIGEFFGNPIGGARQGIEENGSFDVALDFDLDRMSEGAVKDLSIHTNAFYIYGPGLSPKFVGDFSNTSNIQGYNTIRLQELWIQKWLWEKRLSIRVGNMAVDNEYFQSSSAAVFINSTFGYA